MDMRAFLRVGNFAALFFPIFAFLWRKFSFQVGVGGAFVLGLGMDEW